MRWIKQIKLYTQGCVRAADHVRTAGYCLSAFRICCFAHFLNRDFSFAIQNCMVQDYKPTLQEDVWS
jgi:hypothetical protein